MKVACFTNKGKVRSNNEDSILVGELLFSEKDFRSCECVNVEGSKLLFAVADGMGGHAKGEVASRLVLESLRDSDPACKEEEIREALAQARKNLEEYVKSHPESYGMGCAIAGLVVEGGKGIAFNVGDCRAYRFINGKLVKLTRDHSAVEELVLDGVITPQEARTHPQRNILTSAVIGDGYTTELKVFTTEVDKTAGGRFLICSDGLWDELEDDEIESCMATENPCQELLKVIDTKPLRDNVSFILLP